MKPSPFETEIRAMMTVRLRLSLLLQGCLGLACLPLSSSLFAQTWPDDITYESYDVMAEGSDDPCSPGREPEWSSPCSTDYGYCWTSSGLSDQLAARIRSASTSMAAQGVIYAPTATQFYQGVASGGHEQNFEFGGKLDQYLILDSGTLGLWQGMTMTLHAETRYGHDVNFDAVDFAPANVAMLYPKFNEHDTAITGLSFAQALDERTQVTFGKFNALDLFATLYPQTGRGVTGFMNTSMVIPLAVARVVPLSYMGAGVMRFHEKQVQGGLLVYDTHNVTTTSGFDELFDNGANIMAYWRFFTEAGGLPGSHFFGGIWSTGEFASLDPVGFVIIPGEGLIVPRERGAYSLIYILEQSLWIDPCDPRRNIGLLSQWALSDEETSPFGWSGNVGIQATGFNRSRPHDTLGIGYFYSGLSDDFQNLLSPVLELQDVQGVELYHTWAVSKCFQVTANLQAIEPANVDNDTALVVGLRGMLGL